MTIETETRFLGMFLGRKPVEGGIVVRPKNKQVRDQFSGFMDNRKGAVVGSDQLVLRYDRSVIVAGHYGREATVATSEKEMIITGSDINRANFRVSGKRFPGLTKRLVWRLE